VEAAPAEQAQADTSAQEAAAEPEPDLLAELPEDLRRILEQMEAVGADIQSLRADVEYERVIELLDEFEKAAGHMAYLKPNRLRLELGKPRNEELITDGEHWWVISHEDKQVEIYRMAGTAEGAPEAAFLTFAVGGAARELVEHYRIELIEGREPDAAEDGEAERPALHRLKFTPRDENAMQQFAAVEVEVREGNWLPERIVLHESDGEILHRLRFLKVTRNPELKPEDFVYEQRKGYAEVRPAVGLQGE
jgi:outer membrane lipoprotein-sorting protein